MSKIVNNLKVSDFDVRDTDARDVMQRNRFDLVVLKKYPSYHFGDAILFV